MPRLSKPNLLREVEKGFQAGGWSVLFLTPHGEHPARYRISRDGVRHTVRVYIWNVSHGGGPRNAAEFRIQVTGINPHQFLQEPGGKTLILGYWDNEEVFAGFDHAFHSAPLGGSPSLQIGEAALLGANQHRFAVHRKGTGELALAFMPDFLGTYVDHLEALHATGTVPAEAELLNRLATDLTEVDEPEIEATIAEPRQYAVTETRRALRALDFRSRVLTAYSHRCAMCSVQLRLLDGAHILPVAEAGSTDETRNGIALCALHHRAYDRSLVTFDQDFRIHVHAGQVRDLQASGHDGRLAEFRAGLRTAIHLPPAAADRPHPTYVTQANALRGWVL